MLNHLFGKKPPSEVALRLGKAAQCVQNPIRGPDRQEFGEELKLPHRFAVVAERVIVRPAKQIVRLLKTRQGFRVNLKISAEFLEFVMVLLRAVFDLVLPERPGVLGIACAAAQIPKDAGWGRRHQCKFIAGIAP